MIVDIDMFGLIISFVIANYVDSGLKGVKHGTISNRHIMLFESDHVLDLLYCSMCKCHISVNIHRSHRRLLLLVLSMDRQIY
jgi:hypothetical protein